MEQNFKNEMIERIDKLIKNKNFKNKSIIIFGHCNATEEMIDYLFINGFNIRAILDNNVNKQGNTYKGVGIVSPKHVDNFTEHNSIVLIANRFFESMSLQLRGLGYKGEIIKVVDYNTFSEYSLSDETINKKMKRVTRGIEIIEMLRKTYFEHHLVVCPNKALGDIYWTCAFLPEYLKKNGINAYVIIVIGNGCREVAELFEAGNIMVITPIEMDELVQGIIFNHEKDCIIAHHDRPYTDNIIKYLDKHFLSFIDYYKYAVFGLDERAIPIKPHRLFKSGDKSKLIKGKSVIIAPYAKSVVQPPKEFWQGLVADYKEQGFYVFTYVYGDEEPLENTSPISFSISEFISAVEYSGCFVGLRSGLCDIIHTANCEKIVVMPDCIYSTTNTKVADFFALPGWEQIIYKD